MSGHAILQDCGYSVGEPQKSNHVNGYEQLIGQSFIRLGTRFTVVKCHGATVVAAFLHNQRVRRMLVPLNEVLKSLDVQEVELTALPEQKSAEQKAEARS